MELKMWGYQIGWMTNPTYARSAIKVWETSLATWKTEAGELQGKGLLGYRVSSKPTCQGPVFKFKM